MNLNEQESRSNAFTLGQREKERDTEKQRKITS